MSLPAHPGVVCMRRLVISATLIAIVLSVLDPAAEQQTVFKGTTDIVRIFATVTDRDGRLVTNLAQEQFEVRDEGKVQPIAQFDSRPQPIRLIVLLDVSGSMEGNLPLLRAASSQLFSRLRQDDVVRVGAFGHEITISPSFTNDPAVLSAALPSTIAPDAPTPLYGALEQALDAFGNADDRRAVILILSDGKDSGPISFRRRPISQAEIIDRARREDVMIYGVGMRSRSRQPISPGIGPRGLQAALMADLPDPGLARVAEDTGGGYTEIRFGQDLAAAFAAVADELHSQYLLGIAPPQRDGKTHDVNVRVNQNGLKARARKSYVAPKG